MASVGIMGGTFNPIHNGHIEIAKAAYQQFHLDEVWFMPNHIPAHKSNEALIHGTHRLEMVKLAIKNYPYFTVSDYELRREGKTYTYETITALLKEYPMHTFSFIMGGDSLFYFDKWVHPEIIIANTRILSASRSEYRQDEIRQQIIKLREDFQSQNFELISCEELPCSSSGIRTEISNLSCEGKLVSSQALAQRLMIPMEVLSYIIEHKLYQA